MKLTSLIITLCAAFSAAHSIYAQSYIHLLPEPSETIYLYPEGQNSDKGLDCTSGPKESNEVTKNEEWDGYGHVSYVGDKARISIYFPNNPNGQMIVVCPGGGYWVVSTHNEGGMVADWLLSKGLTVAVLTYRLPYGHWEAPLTDVQNTFRYCREHSKEWGINQIGIMGFSAGGHLAATASTQYCDDVTKPDFSVLIYPVISFDETITHIDTRNNLLGYKRWHENSMGSGEWEDVQKTYAGLIERFSNENQVNADTPPTFLAHSTDDKTVSVENSIRYYSSLIKYGVRSEMHIYPTGGHGWSFRSEKFLGKGNDVFKYARNEFETSLERWLETIRTQPN